LFKVDERVLIPKFMLNFLSGDELARAADKKRKELEWLWLKMQSYLALTQLACARVQFERTKSDGAVRG
jgi:CRISPR/Cas system CSM-associated protein Csm4 (group 5 of RAMP superfamily)